MVVATTINLNEIKVGGGGCRWWIVRGLEQPTVADFWNSRLISSTSHIVLESMIFQRLTSM